MVEEWALAREGKTCRTYHFTIYEALKSDFSIYMKRPWWKRPNVHISLLMHMTQKENDIIVINLSPAVLPYGSVQSTHHTRISSPMPSRSPARAIPTWVQDTWKKDIEREGITRLNKDSIHGGDVRSPSGISVLKARYLKAFLRTKMIWLVSISIHWDHYQLNGWKRGKHIKTNLPRMENK